MSSLVNILLVSSLVGMLVIADTPVDITAKQTTTNALTPGYSALKLFLEDEQYLTAIRQTKTLISFSGISDGSRELIDEISDSSELAAEELEKLAAAKPAFVFEEFSDEKIGKATLDSLRMTIAKEFLFSGDEFEKELLLSQLNTLRVISHLAKQLEEKENNTKRKLWLAKLADRYEDYYQQVKSRIFISKKI